MMTALRMQKSCAFADPLIRTLSKSDKHVAKVLTKTTVGNASQMRYVK